MSWLIIGATKYFSFSLYIHIHFFLSYAIEVRFEHVSVEITWFARFKTAGLSVNKTRKTWILLFFFLRGKRLHLVRSVRKGTDTFFRVPANVQTFWNDFSAITPWSTVCPQVTLCRGFQCCVSSFSLFFLSVSCFHGGTSYIKCVHIRLAQGVAKAAVV